MKVSWRSLAQFILLPACSVTFALLMIEVLLRIGGWQADFFFQPDPDISATYIPGKRGWNVIGTRRQWIEINSFGYRDREWSVAEPPETYRIALLGDSYVAGMEVPTEQRLGELLQRRLNTDCSSGTHVEVLNFGVTGYGTAQELETLRHRALQFHPDLVMLFFYTGNDLFDNSTQLDPEPNRLHYVLSDSGELRPQPFTVSDSTLKRWLRAHSKAYNFLRDHISTLEAVHRAMMRVGLMQDSASEGQMQNALQTLQGSQYLRDTPPAIDNAWSVSKALIAEVHRVVSVNRAKLLVVLVPTKPAILNVTPSSDGNRDRWDMDQPAKRMLRICADLGIDCLDLTKAFRKPGVTVDPCFFFEGHWTPLGHRVAADAVSAALHDSLCPRDGGSPDQPSA